MSPLHLHLRWLAAVALISTLAVTGCSDSGGTEKPAATTAEPPRTTEGTFVPTAAEGRYLNAWDPMREGIKATPGYENDAALVRTGWEICEEAENRTPPGVPGSQTYNDMKDELSHPRDIMALSFSTQFLCPEYWDG